MRAVKPLSRGKAQPQRQKQVPRQHPNARKIGEGLDAPVDHLPAVVFDVKENLAMWVGPIIFGDGAFENLEIFGVVFGAAVMSPQRWAEEQETGKQEREPELPSHALLPK